MPNTLKEHLSILAILILVSAIFIGTGSFSLLHARQSKTEIAARITKHEKQISSMKRLNEEVTTQIAARQNPQELRKLAKERLSLPKSTAVVWGYGKIDGAKPDTSAEESDVLVSFRTTQPQKSRNL